MVIGLKHVNLNEPSSDAATYGRAADLQMRLWSLSEVANTRDFQSLGTGSIPVGTTTVSMQPPFQEMYAIWPLPLIGLGGWPLKPAMLSSNLAGVTIKERCNILWDYLVYNNEFPYYSPKMIWLINNIGVR